DGVAELQCLAVLADVPVVDAQDAQDLQDVDGLDEVAHGQAEPEQRDIQALQAQAQRDAVRQVDVDHDAVQRLEQLLRGGLPVADQRDRERVQRLQDARALLGGPRDEVVRQNFAQLQK